MSRSIVRLTAAIVCIAALSSAAAAQGPNLLTNPDFETGNFFGWGIFVNSYMEMANPPQFVPNSGSYMVSMFGGFFGPSTLSVSGIFQSFPAQAGDAFELDCYTRHWSGDAITGVGAPNDNWAIQRIAFFDASNTEIPNTGNDSVVLDGTFATDTWHYNPPVQAVAPVGTVTVQALVMILQPGLAPGAVHVDDVSFRKAFGLGLSQDPMTLDLTIGLSEGEALAQFGIFHSFDPLNATMPGTGNLGGMHIATADLNAQLALVFAQTPGYGGFLDMNGATSSTIPGSLVGALSGIQVFGVGAQLTSTGAVQFTPMNTITFQ